MRTVIPLLTFLLLEYAAFGQTTEQPIDTLLAQLKNYQPKDSTRVKLIHEYIKNNFLTNPDSSLLRYADEALDISQKINWPKGITMSYQRRGIVYLYVLSDFANALSNYLQAIKANEVSKIPFFSGQMYSNVGIVFQENKLFRKALNYHHLSLSEAKREKMPEKDLTRLYNNTGMSYTELKMTDSALYFYEKALKQLDEKSDPVERATILFNAGYGYIGKGDYDKAKEYLERSITLADKSGFALGKTLALNNMAQLYLKKGEPLLAEKYAKETLTLLEELPSSMWTATALQTLSGAYSKTGKFKEAYDVFNRSYLIVDSTLNAATDEKLSFLEAQFEYDKKEAVLTATHAAEIRQQKTVKYALIGGSALLLLGGAFSFFFYKRKRDAQSLQKEAELKAAISDVEMKALRAQMNPHFIFNSLNSISDYIARNNTQLADEYLAKFAKLMRLILENSEQKEVALSKDLHALELYMQLEALRMNHKFGYEIKVADDIDTENTLVPPLILQPFVENSIWHGIAGKQGPGKITIQVKREDGMLSCSVEDDGVGRTTNPKTVVNERAKKSLGMKITSERIAILNRMKHSHAKIELSDLVQGTKVQVKLPLELSF